MPRKASLTSKSEKRKRQQAQAGANGTVIEQGAPGSSLNAAETSQSAPSRRRIQWADEVMGSLTTCYSPPHYYEEPRPPPEPLVSVCKDCGASRLTLVGLCLTCQLDRLPPESGSCEESDALELAREMDLQSNVLDAHIRRPSQRWLSRGWKCYAAEIGCCEPNFVWDQQERAFTPFEADLWALERCRCICWGETSLLRRGSRKIYDLHPSNGRRRRMRGDPRFEIELGGFGVRPPDPYENIKVTVCTRCRTTNQFSEQECTAATACGVYAAC